MTPDKNLDQTYQQLFDKPPNSSKKVKIGFYAFIICSIAISYIYLRIAQAPTNLADSLTFSNEPSPYRRETFNPAASDIDSITELFIHPKRHQILATSKSEQTLPMVVSLEARGFYDDLYRPPLDLVCIVDLSRDKIHFVRDTLDCLLPLMDDEDRLSFIVWDENEKFHTLLPLVNTTQQNKDKMRAIPYIINTGNKSTLSKSFDAAFKILNKETRNQATAFLVISDRLENEENAELKRKIQMPDNRSKQAPLTGTVLPRDIFQMAQYGDSLKGNIFFLDKFDCASYEISAFMESMRALQTTVAENVEFFIRAELAGSEFLNDSGTINTYEGQPISSNYGRLFTTKSANLITNRRQDILLDLKIPSFPIGLSDDPIELTVVSCRVVLTLSDGSQIVKEADLKVTFVNELGSEKDSKGVMKYYYRHKGAKMIEEARQLQYEGKSEEALDTVKKCKEVLENCGLRDDVIIQSMLKDIEKRMKYNNMAADFSWTVSPLDQMSFFVENLYRPSFAWEK